MQLSQIQEAEGPISRPVVEVARLLVDCVDFQRRVKAANSAAAAERVHLFDFTQDPQTMHSMRPFASLFPRQLRATGAYLRMSGVVILQLNDKEKFPDDHGRSGLDFGNWAGQVFNYIREAAAVSDRLPVETIEQAENGPFRGEPKDDESAGRYWWTEFYVHWNQDA